MMQRCLLTLLFGFLFACGMAAQQEVRFNLKGGLSSWSFRDERAIYDSSLHPGQSVTAGFFIPLKTGALLTGLSLQRFTVESQSNALGINEGPHFTYLLFPVQYVYTMYARSGLDLSLLGGGDIMVFYDIDDNLSGLAGPDMRGVVPCLLGGVRAVFFGHLTLDLQIRFGLVPLVFLREESTARSFSMEIGWMF